MEVLEGVQVEELIMEIQEPNNLVVLVVLTLLFLVLEVEQQERLVVEQVVREHLVLVMVAETEAEEVGQITLGWVVLEV
jgi:hypothetical protein